MTAEISLNSIFQKSENLVEADMGDALVLLSVEQGIYLELAGTAGAVWKAIDGYASVHSIVIGLLNLYDIDEPNCVAETRSFLQQALDKRLIHLVC